MKYFITAILITFFNVIFLFGNNLVIGTPSFAEQDTDNNFVMVQFDMSWDNSWRVITEPNNYDGVWLFVKYKKTSDKKWYHATLNNNDYNHNTGSQGTEATIQVSDGKGAMFYRSSDGSGTFSSSNIQLQWRYGFDKVGDKLNEEILEIQVIGIEMVYVPEGPFYVGSGGNEISHFYTYGSNDPFKITSENAINVGTQNGCLYYYTENYYGDGEGPIPSTFPKGYAAFWCMKYEITQEQYVDFLNTLTREQQNTRTKIDISSTYLKSTYVMSGESKRKPIDYGRNGIRCDSIIPAPPTPIHFYCDFNANYVPNEANDGQYIACNFIHFPDGNAYADWAAMRPMTELEYEKACRGPLYPVPNEYAWGDTIIKQVTMIFNQGEPKELQSPSNSNCLYGSSNKVEGPVRAGAFAREESSRHNSGASYYGIMELSGNLVEPVITVGDYTLREIFTNNRGDGVLIENGNSNTSGWIGTSGIGASYRGGGLYNVSTDCMVSNRYGISTDYAIRYLNTGFRCVVSFP